MGIVRVRSKIQLAPSANLALALLICFSAAGCASAHMVGDHTAIIEMPDDRQLSSTVSPAVLLDAAKLTKGAGFEFWARHS